MIVGNTQNLPKDERLLLEAFETLDNVGTFLGDHFCDMSRMEWLESDSELILACKVDDAMAAIAEHLNIPYFIPIFDGDERDWIDAATAAGDIDLAFQLERDEERNAPGRDEDYDPDDDQ